MFLQVSDNRIKYVSFNIDGCLNTSVCANTVAFLAEGRSIEKAWEITPKDVIDYLGTLPSDHEHCAELAVGAFYKCLAGVKKARNFGHGR